MTRRTDLSYAGLLSLLLASPSFAADTDNDGIDDTLDNCTQAANPDQRDTDGDGYGNLCDGDLDNDGIVSTVDLVLLRNALSTGGSAAADFDGDGAVNSSDLSLFRQMLFKPPGPASQIAITSHGESDRVSETGFLLSGSLTAAAGVKALVATLDDPVLGRTIDARPVAFATASGHWTLAVLHGDITPGETIAVALTATDERGNRATQTLALQVVPVDHVGRQLINRITFGATPALLEEIRTLGAASLLNRQLDPESIDDSAFKASIADAQPSTVEELQIYQLRHAIASRRQLLEVMTWFWENHFNTDIRKTASVAYELAENHAFRSNALGRFRDLLEASAKSPAMLVYLDSMTNVKAEPNENYAREVLELHTLGVDGGFTQTDVEQVARAFTGWTVRDGAFHFDAAEHDSGEKHVLDQVITSGGVSDGEQVLDIIASHPSTAQFICTKLSVLLVSDTPPDNLANRCASVFRMTADAPDQIGQVVHAILTSPAFNDPTHYRAKIKTPLELVVGLVRNLNARGNFTDLPDHLRRLGMPLFHFRAPTGYSETGDDWLNAYLLLERIKFVNRIAHLRVAKHPTRMSPVQFFRSQGYETAEGIVGFLFELAFDDDFSRLEWDTALGILNKAGQDAFDIQGPDANQRLQSLIGTVLSFASYQYQ